MKKLNKLFAGLLITCTCTSCGDFLDAYSQDMVIPKSVTDIDEVLLGEVYVSSFTTAYGPTAMRTCGFFNILDDDLNTGLTGYGGGEKPVQAWNNCLFSHFGYYAWQLKVGNNFDSSMTFADDATWNDMYHRINVINILLDEIEELPHETKDDNATYLRVKGEAHFLRAQFYFILANLYGTAYNPVNCDTKPCVPLKLSARVEHDKDKDTQFQRATVKEVYEQIVADLSEAERFLMQSPQLSSRRNYRASIEAVELLFSRVCLYMQDWEQAERKANEVIKSANNVLAPIGSLDAKTFLTQSNSDVIFSQGPNYLATPQIFTAMLGDFCVTKDLFDLYDENDKRKSCFFANAQAGDSIALGSKYERTANIRPHVSDVFTLRVSEAYLNKAEACSMQSGKEEDACTALNTLRKQRIVGYESQTYSGENLVNQIRDERRKELCFEGHRWFDLRRYTVNLLYPYSKRIVHVLNVTGDNGYLYTRYYCLEENDLAYTFAIPQAVIDFDVVPMEGNPREIREPMKVEGEDNGETEEKL